MSPVGRNVLPASQPDVWVCPLAAARLGDRADLGGKSAVLGGLLAEGMPVLPGVAVSRAAYEATIGEAAIAPLAAEYWSGGGGDRQEVAKEIARRLSASPISAEVAAAVLPLLGEQDVTGDLIVRSSATSEDGSRTSFAGQFLSVRSEFDAAALARAIVEVWASATSPHVAQYVSHLSATEKLEAVLMGVLIQPYRQFEVAGILFGQHPTVRLRGWALVEFLDAAPDRIVGGEVTPHRVRLRMSDGKLLWEHRVESEAVLEGRVAKELVTYCGHATDVLGADVDMEWGQQDGKVLVLQARPATHTPWEKE
jgi:phosphoenolpyruvate synthase/pyruvate phosphate dikinase